MYICNNIRFFTLLIIKGKTVSNINMNKKCFPPLDGLLEASLWISHGA